MPEFWAQRPLWGAWALIAVWVLAHAVLKFVQDSGMDIDSAEQVYFAQSWQLGYGTRQPPLYTWLLLAFKPAFLNWEATLEGARYLVLLAWLGGLQALARVCGATPRVQARVLLAHLGLMLVMWRVHDSLTHTVLAAALTLWGSVAVVKALQWPLWWPVVGVLAGLACLAKLNAALWCVASLLSACGVLWQQARTGPTLATSRRALVPHLLCLLLALALCMALLWPFMQWWLAQRDGSVALARRIVASNEALAWWRPLAEVAAGTLEYLLLTPLLLAGMAWHVRGQGGALRSVPLAGRWIRWQAIAGLVLLVCVITGMKGSHFTPRWLWPVVPGLTVWLSMRALERAELLSSRRWHRAFDLVLWGGVVLALLASQLRWWQPVQNAQHCRNCWTDRPGELLSHDLHARYGPRLRVVTGDDHLAGLLAHVNPLDRTWTAVSPDLPAPADFASTAAPCVGAWLDMDSPRAPPPELQALMAGHQASPVAQTAWPLDLAPQRHLYLRSQLLSAQACEQARR